jgi:hypothetical protein
MLRQKKLAMKIASFRKRKETGKLRWRGVLTAGKDGTKSLYFSLIILFLITFMTGLAEWTKIRQKQ